MTQLYSWIDVDNVVLREKAAGHWPPGLVGISAYQDGVEVRVSNDEARSVVEQLFGQWFPERYDPKGGLLLDAAPDKQRRLPVSYEVSADPQQQTVVRPLFRRLARLPAGEGRALSGFAWPSPFPEHSPPLVAFYSFKGGVGRTLHSIAFLRALTDRQPAARALVVDADLEAPGLSTLVQADGGVAPTFSLVDLLALAHEDESEGWRDTTALAAHRLRTQPLPLSLEGKRVDHLFLPAFRNQEQALTLDLRPEHLVEGGAHPWSLGELFARLGSELGVSCVLLDLRAGLSEISGPFLFDPRIRRVVVTSPSRQSLEGTKLVIHELRKIAPPPDRADLRDPSVLVSLVTKELKETSVIERIGVALLQEYTEQPAVSETEAAGLPRLDILETDFLYQLLSIDSLSQGLELLAGTSVSRVMASLADECVPTPTPEVQPTAGLGSSRLTVPQLRERLVTLAKDLEYAEAGKGTSFLSTPQLRALAARFQEEAPVAVVIGSKGAGKTYTFLQIARDARWTGFAKRVLGESRDRQEWGEIWPVLQPRNLGEDAKRVLEAASTSATRALGLDRHRWSQSHAADTLERLAQGGGDEAKWRRGWWRLFSKSLGLGDGDRADGLRQIMQHLVAHKRRVVFVLDGLEEQFTRAATNQAEQTGLRSLIQGLPNQLREYPSCPIGLVVFARADLVRFSIPQNTRQFERLYEPYALRWDEEQALRLAVWLAREAGISLAEQRDLESLSKEDLIAALYPVWGRKLGADNSREGRTAEWVIAALSDFRGQIQARDLVRLVRHAGDRSQQAPQADRLLAPSAIRSALQPCSQEKIREIEQENQVLKAIFTKLRKAEHRRVPFDADDVGLTRQELRQLELEGVILEDEGEYYIPEIFRLGLGFQLAQGARPRVLRLARRARAQWVT